jgi:acyl-CoA reductase-like NAD-dependent aldehyde dehydrogenase
MSACYVTSPVTIRHPDRLFIDGQWMTPSSSATLSVISPSTEQEIAVVAGAANADVDRAVTAARLAFDQGPWPRLSPQERGDFLLRIHAGLEKRSRELAHCWSAQMGSPYAHTSQFTGIHHFAYYGALIKTHPVIEKRANSYGGSALVVREPVGVTAAIIPWNAPMMLISSKVAPALAMGCTVVVKPAIETPLEAFILAEVIEEIGLPPGVFNFVPADRDVGEHLVAHRGVDKVAFTGSTAAGQRIAALCGSRIARYTLELGGKSAAIVLDDIDVEQILPSLVGGCTMQAGQACSALSRVLVSRKRHDKFLEAYAAAFGAARVGDPFDPQTQLGPLALARQLKTVQGYIEKGLAQGAKLAVGGGRPPGLNRGYYIQPTVFYGVTNDMTIAQEEIFGPVAAVIPFDDLEHAVSIANDSAYGLLSAIYTNDDDTAYRLARRLRSGTVSQNMWAYDPILPFGGFKRSGVGREGGPEALDNYTEIKTIFPARTSQALA